MQSLGKISNRDLESGMNYWNDVYESYKLSEETPFSDEVQKQYDASNERIQNANYKMDLEIAKLKRSLWITQITYAVLTSMVLYLYNSFFQQK